MTHYLLSVFHSEDWAPAPQDQQKIFADVGGFNQELMDAGAWVYAGGLQPTSTATVLRLEDDGTVTRKDAPFAEASEPIGGFWIIKPPDIETAIEWGRKATRANTIPCEVRPLHGDAA
ncbi:MAG: hypothetical protein JOY80_13260 [Candidatus Dormibacteraeota bacterium]|nr:hypothetical protein [Candidatus Dormibacteraeota bacterium]